MTQEVGSTSLLEAQASASPVLELMLKRGLPLTRETYLDLSYPDRDLEKQPLGPEELEMVPEGLT